MALERADGSHWRLSGTKQVQVLMRTRFVPEQRRGEGQFYSFFSCVQLPAKWMWGLEGTSGASLSVS